MWKLCKRFLLLHMYCTYNLSNYLFFNNLLFITLNPNTFRLSGQKCETFLSYSKKCIVQCYYDLFKISFKLTHDSKIPGKYLWKRRARWINGAKTTLVYKRVTVALVQLLYRMVWIRHSGNKWTLSVCAKAHASLIYFQYIYLWLFFCLLSI